MNLLPIETALRESRPPDFEVRETISTVFFQHAETGLGTRTRAIEETMAPENTKKR